MLSAVIATRLEFDPVTPSDVSLKLRMPLKDYR